MKFNNLPLSSELLEAIEDMGFTKATSIQSESIPPILEGKDVIGRSSTGTGKTAAFGIPAVEIASHNKEKNSVLILCPTRELCMQTADELHKIAKHIPKVHIATLFGGQEMRIQFAQLEKSRIVVGTPGRVMDHLRRKSLKLKHLKTIILDEADEMLNMGFVDDIRTILESAPEERQTVLFSATMSAPIMTITQDFQNDPVLVAVDGGKKTVDHIEQSYYNIPQGTKNDTIKLLIEYHKPKRALIFCNTKSMVDELCEELVGSGFKAVAIHGDLKQSQRTQVMKRFKMGRANILIATDVAARGIDVDDVEAVFNYDIPQELEYYVHRIGRTGRAGKSGASYTLVSNRTHLSQLKKIEHFMKTQIHAKPVPTIEDIAVSTRDSFAQEIFESVENGDGNNWLDFIDELSAKEIDARTVAAVLCARLQSKNRRLTNVRNVSVLVKEKSKPKQQFSTGTWLNISIGRLDRIAPNYIVGAIVEATDVKAVDLGKINIYNDHTEIEMTRENAELVVEQMENARIKRIPVTLSISNGSGDTQNRENRRHKRDRSGDNRNYKKRSDNGGDRDYKKRSDNGGDRDYKKRSDNGGGRDYKKRSDKAGKPQGGGDFGKNKNNKRDK